MTRYRFWLGASILGVISIGLTMGGGCGGGGETAAVTPSTIRGQVLQPPAAGALSRNINRQGVNGLVAPLVGTVVTWSTFNITNVNGTFTPTAGTLIATGQTTDNQGNYTVTSNAGTQPNANQCVIVGSGSNSMANCVTTNVDSIPIRPATQAGFASCVNFAGQNNINLNTTAPGVLTSVQNYINVFVANAPPTEGSGSVSAGVTSVTNAVNANGASSLQGAQSGLQTSSNGGGGGGTTFTAATFFPLGNGDFRNYSETRTDSSGTTTRTRTEEAQGPVTFNGASVFRVDRLQNGQLNDNNSSEFLTSDANGVQLYGRQEFNSNGTLSCTTTNSPPIRIQNGLSVGQNITSNTTVQSSPGGCDNTATQTFTLTFVASGQTVTVPAGTFTNCIKVTTVETHRDVNGNVVESDSGTTFLAPGVGIVKEDNSDTSGGQTSTESRVLTSFNVGGRTTPSRVIR